MKNRNKDFQPYKQKKVPAEIQFKPFEVTLEQCGGDSSALIKRFMRKVRNSDILKEYYDRMSFKSLGQKRRQKRLKAIYETKKQQKKMNSIDDNKNFLDFSKMTDNYK